MELVRWQQINNLLQAALELDPAERSYFIEEACSGDENLRQEISSLLSFDEQALDIIETPAIEVAACLLARVEPELTAGEYISHYRILSLLGIGGMGEVYLAEDRKLERKIALKLLPAEFTKDPHRVRRFQQEARAASALNHPNIITIYETGKLKNRHFITTEFIEGETLRQRMRQATLNLGEILDIAIQVANALAAAHQAGIIHRDIKPENIMLRPDGYAKVLDFGLAKLSEQSSTGSKQTAEETDTLPGLLMGTVKYMSPEQARGQKLDVRSDIFSLGIVLYEMLVNRLPFQGETNSDVIAAILKEDPAPVSQFVDGLSAPFEYILNKALAKDQDERYQTVNEMLAAMKELRRELEVNHSLTSLRRIESGEDTTDVTGGIRQFTKAATGAKTSAITSVAIPNLSITQRAVRLTKDHKLSASVVLLLAILIVGWAVYRVTKPKRQAAFQEMKTSQLAESDKAKQSAISPDGKYIAYVVLEAGKQRLLLRHLATNTTTVLDPNDAWYYGITFSPEGNSVYYVAWGKDDPKPALYQVSVNGGDSQRILAHVASPITFSPDGKRFAFVRKITDDEYGLFIANVDGNGERLLASHRSPEFFSTAGPSWSPDGKLIACAAITEANGFHVAGVNVEDGTEKLLGVGNWTKVLQVAWLKDNSGLIVAATEKGEGALLWFVSYSDGNARRLNQGMSNYLSDYNSISLTADCKTLVASRFEQRNNVWVAAAGDASEIQQITSGGNHRYQRVAWTSDGKIVFPSAASGAPEIWIMESDGTGQKQLTSGGGSNTLPAASPDNHYIVFTSDRSGKSNIWRMNMDGSNVVQLTHDEDGMGPICSPDSHWVLYLSRISETEARIWKVSIDGGEPVLLTGTNTSGPAISPDGKRIACWWYTANSPGKIALIPFSGGEPVALFTPVPGAPNQPLRWTADGRSLIYCVTRNGVSNIWSQPLDGGTPKQLTDFKSEIIQGFDWSRDDRLLLTRGFTARDIIFIEDIGR